MWDTFLPCKLTETFELQGIRDHSVLAFFKDSGLISLLQGFKNVPITSHNDHQVLMVNNTLASNNSVSNIIVSVLHLSSEDIGKMLHLTQYCF